MLKIKSEIPAKRCEICHQNDKYDAEKNYCERCSDIQKLKGADVKIKKEVNIEVQEIEKDSVLVSLVKIVYVIILGVMPALISALIVPNICSSHCESIFHPFHLFVPIPIFFLGLFAGTSTLYKFKQHVIDAILKILSSTLVAGLVGSLFGVLATLLNDIPKEKLLLGAWFGFEIGAFVSFTFYLLLMLLKLLFYNNYIRFTK